jgi:uncharacterized protein (TIGR03067 family)
MPRTVLLLVASLSLGFAPVPFPKPDPSAADLKAMRGRWRLTDEAVAGRPLGVSGSWRIEIAGDRLRYLNGAVTTAEYVLALDATTRPRRFTIKDVKDAGCCRGVYRLDGNRLTVCYDAGGGGHPESLDSRGRHVHREEFRREGR